MYKDNNYSYKGHLRENVLRDGTAGVDHCGDYMAVLICQNWNHPLKMVNFIACKLYLNNDNGKKMTKYSYNCNLNSRYLSKFPFLTIFFIPAVTQFNLGSFPIYTISCRAHWLTFNHLSLINFLF